MKFIEKSLAPHTAKPHGTDTWYYTFLEHEVHYNEIKPGTEQPWHRHQETDETIYVLSGLLTVKWVGDDKQIQSKEIGSGTLARIETFTHSISNTTEELSTFLVFKFVPQGKDLHELIKHDKVDNIHISQ